ncbi:MAG: hydrogen peroxide-inducible genes activator [Crocinitomicaceae bacterium]|nr:hydrogen peroxide-inducible genes activator [Crocinitomicaceae bacterium]
MIYNNDILDVNINGMNVRQFEYILAVAKYKHFELAAEHCFATQSTLSTMISKFEEEIGIKIFDRKRKPVEITKEGELILEQLKHINTSIEELTELTKEIKGEIKGNLRIAAIPTIAPFLLPLFLQNFAAKFPELHIEIRELTTQEIIHRLKRRELDIGILSTPLKEEDIVEHHLYNEPFVLYDTSNRYKKTTQIQDIAAEDLWLMEEGHCMRTQIMNLCELNQRTKNPTLNFDFRAGSIDSLLRFVKAHTATTLLPYLATLEFSENEKQQVKAINSPVPQRAIGLVVHRYFVKKTVLDLLKNEIIEKVAPLLPKDSKNTIELAPL